MKTIIIFLLIFSIIVVIHEFGHYYFAKKAGILVREFSIGMGPKLFSMQDKDHTTYTLRILPLGGYVRLAGLGEEEDLDPGMEVSLTFNQANEVIQINKSKQSNAEELPVRINQFDLMDAMQIEAIPLGQESSQVYPVSKRAMLVEADGTMIPVAPRERRYESVSVWNKIKTNFAGPLNNFILSIVLFTAIAFALPNGVPVGPADTSNEPVIGQVSPGSSAEEAGLQTGDKVLEVNQETVTNWDDLVAAIQANGNHEVQLLVERDNQEQTIKVKPSPSKDPRTGEDRLILGIVKDSHQAYSQALSDKLLFGFITTWGVITGVFEVLASMLMNGFNLNNFGGPVAMAQMTSQAVSFGWLTILNFMAYISANLGVFNLLPIPALDGGKIVLNLIELVRGKPLSQSKEGIITLIGAILLIILMVAVTWNDIQRAFF